MPTNLPSSFASAAAGQNAARGGRGDGRGAGDWSRGGRSANGTMTFRRTSTTPLGQLSQGHAPPNDGSALPTPAESIANQPNYDPSAARYSKEEMLEMFQQQKNGDASRLFLSGWDPSNVNGAAGRGWGKSNDNHVPQEPGACWDQLGESTPLGLQGRSSEEKEAFSTDINSPLKPPTQNKEGQANANGRKGSVSQGSGNAYNVASPSSAQRPGTRRRETSESNAFGAAGLASPTTNRFGRDEQPAWLPRKADEAETEDSTRAAIGNLMRTNTAGSAGIGSMWPPSNPATPGAGGFGNFAIGGGSSVGDKRAAGGAGGSRLAHLIPKDGDAAKPADTWRSRPRTDTDPFGDSELSGSAVLGGSQDSAVGANRTKGSVEDFGMSGLHMGERGGSDDLTNSSEPNPYRGPAGDRFAEEGNGQEKPPADQHSSFNTLPRAFGGAAFDGSDRSQTSSVGAKAYPLGALAGWPAPPPTGTPDRERANFGNAFGSSLFGNMGDMQSPALGNLGNVFGPSSGLGAGSIGRGSKLGSLFPAAMQAQMQNNDTDGSTDGADSRQNNPLGAIGRGGFPGPARDTDSPMRSGRGAFEDLFPTGEGSGAHSGFPGDATPGGTIPQSFTPVSGSMPFGGGQPEPHGSQPRQMVMPDRMRWVYLDPQAQIQGPFTGLEMNDWYKANFFTPDLRVKKVEDVEFEPLGQLIRRIGNSREPFLVPQIGVAHGPASQTGPFSSNAGVVPPLSGVFPSFGRTLTADEQNNLERRKQEEQYLMAQQRDYMMRAQAMSKYAPNLQHQPSAHSLQSQPSFGSIANPIGMPQPPGAGIASGSFTDSGMPRQGAGNGEPFRQEDLANLSATERQMLSNLDDDDNAAHAELSEQIARAGLPETGELADDSEGFKGRLQEFEGLRAQHEAEQAAAANQKTLQKSGKGSKTAAMDDLSLTEQVQIAQAAAAAGIDEIGLPMPFPPPSSTTPLPAPTAQRVRSNLPEQYSRSQTATPEVVQPPPMAPWAKDSGSDGPKGPSLKEIQEAESRKAAKAEQEAAAVRRAVMEQEGAAMRERERAVAAAAAAAALPASSTWGHGSPAAAGTPWTKPGSVKPSTSGSVASPGPKSKTLAEIQREEEIRKQKAKDVATQSGAPIPGAKSYVSLAGKAPPPGIPAAVAAAAPPPGAGWATVGAGGKVKTPTTAPAAAAAPIRAASAAIAKPPVAPAAMRAAPKPVSAQSTAATAMDEFNKWTQRELSRGITGITDISGFQGALNELPLDTGIIADAVYANSTTMDGRHFAEEYVRRKKLAEKGVVEKHSSADRAVSGGWSEVAKKGGNAVAPAQQAADANAAGAEFKIVSGKKKGRK